MGEAPDLLQDRCEVLVAVLGEVVVHEGGLVGGGADGGLLELHLDEAALGAELDDVALDLDGHARHELGALEDGEDVVQRGAALELERREAGRDLVEAGGGVFGGGGGPGGPSGGGGGGGGGGIFAPAGHGGGGGGG